MQCAPRRVFLGHLARSTSLGCLCRRLRRLDGQRPRIISAHRASGRRQARLPRSSRPLAKGRLRHLRSIQPADRGAARDQDALLQPRSFRGRGVGSDTTTHQLTAFEICGAPAVSDAAARVASAAMLPSGTRSARSVRTRALQGRALTHAAQDSSIARREIDLMPDLPLQARLS